jgi:hypothetical protein
MAITAEVAEDAAAKAAAAAKRKAGAGARDAHRRVGGAGAAGAAPAATEKSPVFGLYERLAELFRDTYGVVCGLRSAPLPGCDDDAGFGDAEDKAAVIAAWAPIEKRLRQLALAGAMLWLPPYSAPRL